MTEDWSSGVATERTEGLQAAGDERVHGEQDDECEDRDPGPGQRQDPDDRGEHATQDQRSAEGLQHDSVPFVLSLGAGPRDSMSSS